MSNRSWSLMSAAGAIALLPLAVPHGSLKILSSTAHEQRVITATSPLDLASLSDADFGDSDTTR